MHVNTHDTVTRHCIGRVHVSVPSSSPDSDCVISSESPSSNSSSLDSSEVSTSSGVYVRDKSVPSFHVPEPPEDVSTLFLDETDYKENSGIGGVGEERERSMSLGNGEADNSPSPSSGVSPNAPSGRMDDERDIDISPSSVGSGGLTVESKEEEQKVGEAKRKEEEEEGSAKPEPQFKVGHQYRTVERQLMQNDVSTKLC